MYSPHSEKPDQTDHGAVLRLLADAGLIFPRILTLYF